MLFEIRNDEYRWRLNEQNRDDMGSFYLKRLSRNKFSKEPVIELWSFGIYGQHRGKGYGKKMLNEVIELVGENKLMLFVYKDNEVAINLYKKAGFKIVGEYSKYAWAMAYAGNVLKVKSAECAACRV